MPTLMDRLKAEEEKLNREQEDSHGDNEMMKAVFQKIQLYKRYLKEDDLTELERLMISNRKEWQMSHLLSLIIHEETIKKLSELAERVHRLERANGIE